MTTEQIASTLLEIADFLKSQNDPYAELKAAHKAGKVIQSFNHERGIWQDCPSPAFEGGTAYRIKPEAKPFQLPPPPPGMRWHREDGWEEGDLPQGWRPLINGEIVQKNDEVKNANLDGDCFIAALGSIGWEVGYTHKNQYCRTRRPLIFTHAGKQWTWRRPGDPCPVPGNTMVHVFTRDNDHNHEPDNADDYEWGQIDGIGHLAEIIGWRYADETKTVPLGPEDVPPASVFRGPSDRNGEFGISLSVGEHGMQFPDGRFISFDHIKVNAWQINRSIPLTGRWDPSAWEPCHKPA